MRAMLPTLNKRSYYCAPAERFFVFEMNKGSNYGSSGILKQDLTVFVLYHRLVSDVWQREGFNSAVRCYITSSSAIRR